MSYLVRKIIFFAIIFVGFCLGCKLSCALKHKGMNNDAAILLSGLVYTGLIIGVYFIAKLDDKDKDKDKDSYKLFQISPGALCRGGPYMWQGNSARAKMCREMASTKQGRADIARFQCPVGYHGEPKNPPTHSNNSDSCWKGPCEDMIGVT